jgi:hypothetical protein
MERDFFFVLNYNSTALFARNKRARARVARGTEHSCTEHTEEATSRVHPPPTFLALRAHTRHFAQQYLARALSPAECTQTDFLNTQPLVACKTTSAMPFAKH